MSANLLVIGDALTQLSDFEPVVTPGLPRLSTHRFPVIIWNAPGIPFDASTLESLQNLKGDFGQVILISEGHDTTRDLKVLNEVSLFKIVSQRDDQLLRLTVSEALEEFRLLEQNAELEKLHFGLQERMEKIRADLEKSTSERASLLKASLRKLDVVSARLENLERGLFLIFESRSVTEIEERLSEFLRKNFGIRSVHVSFRQDHPTQAGQIAFAIRSAEMVVGTLLIVSEKTLTDEEVNAIDEMAQAIGIAIERLAKFEQIETLKQQWQITFDSILDPVCLVTDRYQISRHNSAYEQLLGSSGLIGRKCYEVFAARKSPCKGCHLHPQNQSGRPFELEAGKRTLVVTTAPILTERLWMVHYRDVTEERQRQRQQLESEKEAELGLVGSSIAHELNNPLAGMLNYVQLIKMDLKGTEPYADDIRAIEEGLARCRDIVRQLLSAARQNSDTNS